MPPRKFKRNRVIAVDVDGTLFSGGKRIEVVAEWCRKQKNAGFFMILWSARGQEYAQQACDHAEMHDVFDVVLGKPGYIVDDVGWRWINFTKVVSPAEVRGECYGF